MSTTQETGTYRTLDEQMERLSPAEQRFERARQTIGLFVGPLVFVALLLIPMPIDDNQQRLAAVLGFTIVFWLSEAIPIPATAILSLALCVLLQVPVIPSDSDDSASDIVYGSFASDTIFLFIGAFVIAQAMKTHGLDRRFAFRVLSLPGVASSTYAVIIAFGAIAALLSSVISNTATAAMLLPIGLGMMRALGDLVVEQSDEDADASRLRFGTALMLMISYGAGVGGLLTPIGTPPNLIGIAFIESETDTTITFFDWVITGRTHRAADVHRPLRDPDPPQQAGGATAHRCRRLHRGAEGRARHALARREEHAGRLRGRGHAVGAPGFVALFAGDESDAYAWVSAPPRRGHGRDPGGSAAVRAARRLGPPPVHDELERGREDRLGHRHPLRLRHRARHPALADRARRDPRHRHRRQLWA